MNSSVYRLLLIDTSESTIFHGHEMSRKPWAYQMMEKFDANNVFKDGP
ncbi:hypothetical protein FHR61_003123 [Xanthomonas arboricola]|nr:hypothetical protein [Xanthomonas cannabis]